MIAIARVPYPTHCVSLYFRLTPCRFVKNVLEQGREAVATPVKRCNYETGTYCERGSGRGLK